MIETGKHGERREAVCLGWSGEGGEPETEVSVLGRGGRERENKLIIW